MSPISQLHFNVSKLVGEIVYFCMSGYRWGESLDRPLQRSWGVNEEEERAAPLSKTPEPSQPSGQARDTGLGAGLGKALHKDTVAPAFFSSGSRSEAVSRADGSPVAAEVWQGSFLWPHFGSNDDTPWASAGHGLVETFSHFRAPVRRMRETNPDSRDRGGGLGPPREHQPPPRGGQSAPSECPGR